MKRLSKACAFFRNRFLKSEWGLVLRNVAHLIGFTIIGFILHELAHLCAALALGHDAVIRINSVSVLTDPSTIDRIFIDLAGPVMTIALAVAGLWGVLYRNSVMGFNLLVAMTAQRSLAAGMSLLANPNDEYRIGEALSIGAWTIHVIVLVILGGMLFFAASKIRPGWMYLFWAWLGISIGVSLVVFGEPYLPSVRFGAT